MGVRDIRSSAGDYGKAIHRRSATEVVSSSFEWVLHLVRPHVFNNLILSAETRKKIFMSSAEVKSVIGTGVPLLLDDIDTDRIIPARFLRSVTFDGLGKHVFEDDRKQDPHHPFSQSQYQHASVLIAGRNFGCGSSREHAPQSLMRWGIKAIVAESFAEIFFGNCGVLGIAAVRASRDDLTTVAAKIGHDPDIELTVDLQALSVTAGQTVVSVEMPDSLRDALVTGEWDFLSELLSAQDEVTAHAGTVPYLNGFVS